MTMQTNPRAILEGILKTEVKLEGAQENVRILENVLELLIDQMKKVDPLFNKVFSRIFYTGSYYERLRVKEATEFDLNLVLTFPFSEGDFEISLSNSIPSFAKFHLTTRMEDLLVRNEWKEMRCALQQLFTENYLMPNRIRQWFQGVVDKAMNNLSQIREVSKIIVAAAGPARTLHIRKICGGQLDVDLVPVIEFKWTQWPLNAKQYFPNLIIPDTEKYCFIVPKPAPTELVRRGERPERLWRSHFPGIERHLLHDEGCVKPVIKLMKLLRDRQNWSYLASYYLKTVVMWSIINDRLDWNTADLDKLFLMMLKKLNERIKRQNLPYLFYPSFNLLYKLRENPSLASNIHNGLTRIIRNIESNPSFYDTLLKQSC